MSLCSPIFSRQSAAY